ncbi:DUF6493 family protein [Streptomyces sp. SID3343]|uniref:DUF6493 family protein n=1 Tax=Streptomyces sp. SID3343 TaxID=2690260 RepID=UPI001370A626|nr:DUF6493 family protein [Streptomyces sp. SID3343]MYW00862.1 hypothetical protein [Streptomyces sp. SID3343]
MTASIDDRAEPLTWERLRALAPDEHAAMVAAFAGRTEAERRALVPDIKESVKKLRDAEGFTHRRLVPILRVAGAACLGGAATIAQWLARRDLQWGAVGSHRPVLAVLRDRKPEWIPEIAGRLAAKLPADAWSDDWDLADLLARAGGLPAPTSDGYVLGWVRHRSGATRGTGARSLAEQLGGDAYFLPLLPHLFEVAGVGQLIEQYEAWSGKGDGWGPTLVQLTEARPVEREVVLDGCVSRLLRSERPGALRAFVRMHEQLKPTEDELAARTTAYLRLLPDAPSPVAGLAQDVLRGLDAAGRLSAEQVAEASRSVLFRAEKKLVRTQLTWLGQALKRHPDHAEVLLVSAGTVFGSPATDLQERAVALIAKHTAKWPADRVAALRAELRDSLGLLGDVIRAEAIATLGGAGEEVEPTEDFDLPLLPPAPRELPAPIASLDELVEEISVLFAGTASPWVSWRGRSADPIAIERIVSALLREHANDRAALHAALLPITERHAHIVEQRWFAHQVQGAIGAMVAAATGLGGSRPGWFRSLFGKAAAPDSDLDIIPGGKPEIDRIEAPQRFLLARLYEVAQRLRVPTSGPYLAEIVTATGHVDPEALVAGLEEWESTGATPWRRDVDQALLRLPADLDPALVARAGRLTSPAGLRVAKTFAAGGLPPGIVDHKRFDRVHREYVSATRKWIHLDGPLAWVAPMPDGLLPESAGSLYSLLDPGDVVRRRAWSESTDTDLRCWTMILPQARDVLAAHLAIRTQSSIDRACRGAEALPLLAEAEGPLGAGMSIALTYAFGAHVPEDRTAAVDAFITLAARDEPWDAGALGRDIGEAIRTRGLKTNRVVASLQEAARAGAHEAVWGVLGGLLPDLLSGRKATGIPAALALAAETAAKSGARDVPIRGLDALADKKSGSRAVVEAKRLRKVLTG